MFLKGSLIFGALFLFLFLLLFLLLLNVDWVCLLGYAFT